MLHSRAETGYLAITINTTEDCNLRCKYCYEVNKCNKSIDFETCKKFIDLIFSDGDWKKTVINRESANHNRFCFDFIGGDSLIDVDLLDKLFTYITTKAAQLDDCAYIFSISTNGTLFKFPKVKRFCEKWKDTLSVQVSIDGCPEIHDMNRVYPDGRGSMEDILESWDWYKRTFPYDSTSTKSTCSKNSIPYLYDSLVFMHEVLGFTDIHQNFIMEDMGLTDEDLKLLDEQLARCVKYVADHQDNLYWSMIDINNYCLDKDLDKPQCGSGMMPTLSIDGNIYPCHRWLPHTQFDGVGAMCVGNVEEGINHPEVFARVQEGCIRRNCTKDPKCLECPYEPACSYCIAGCYAEFGDFIRTTHICEITKLMCKWSKIYWEQYFKGDLNERIRRG